MNFCRRVADDAEMMRVVSGTYSHSASFAPLWQVLFLLDALKQYAVGDSFTYNSPTVLCKTVSIGNGFGWVVGIPLADVGG